MSLRNSAQQALIWSAGLNFLRDAIQFGQMLIMVRLLEPAIYGQWGMAIAVINFIGVPGFQHFVAHSLQVRAGTIDWHRHFSAGLRINGVLFLICNLVAVGSNLSDVYASLQPLLHILSISFLLSVPNYLRLKMLERELNWTRIRNLQFLSILVTVTTAIPMALLGAGVFSLIVPGLIGLLPLVIDLFFVKRWRPRWTQQLGDYSEAWRFGITRTGSSFLWSGRALFQSAWVTQHFQFGGLGEIGRAEGLSNLLCGRVAQEVNQALHPVITRVDARSARFQHMSGLILRAVAWVALPAAGFIGWNAQSVVGTVYGPKWISVVPLLPLAVSGAAIHGIGDALKNLLLANDRVDLVLKADLAAAVLAIFAILLTAPMGLQHLLTSLLGLSVIVTTMLSFLLVRTYGITIRAIWLAVFPAVVSSIISLVGTSMSVSLWQNVHPAFDLLLRFLIFSLIYGLVLRLLWSNLMAQTLSYLPKGDRLAKFLFLRTAT